MKIIIDCDGVLANFNKRCLDRINQEHQLEVQESDIKEWDWLRGHLKIPAAALNSLVSQWVYEEGFVYNMEIYPGAVDAVDALREIGSVVCVTSPWHSPNWVTERDLWLKTHFNFRPHDIIHASGKYHVFGHMIIDDKPSNVEDWLDQAYVRPGWPGTYPGIVWAQPYNENVGTGDGLLRTNDWAQVIRQAQKIKESL